jgi:hypothetical protein
MLRKSSWEIPIGEMRERYLKLYSAAINDVLRFKYKMNCCFPSGYLPLRKR